MRGGTGPKTPGSGDEREPPPLPGRTFTLELPAGLKTLSLNDRHHWSEKNRRAAELKKAAWAMALKAKVPHLERVSLVVEYQPPDKRHRDGENVPIASGKHAIDGLVAAGVIPDDECPRYVAGIWCTIGEVFPKGRLVLHLTEVAA